MNYRRLINKSIQSHTLMSDFLGYMMMGTGMADKYLARLAVRNRTYMTLSKEFVKYVGNCNVETSRLPEKEYVWICWFQGMENAPRLVQNCYNSICYWLKDKTVVLITGENYRDYTDLPEHIIRKWEEGIITNTHFSDILRLELLIRHGGLWLDATTLLTGPLPEYIGRSDFFVYRNGWMDQEKLSMASWLIYSRKTNNILLAETRNLLFHYWEKRNYLKDYFLLHLFFHMVCEIYEDEWRAVPYFNHIDNHLLVESVKYTNDAIRVADVKMLTSVHKLTYKFDGNSEWRKRVENLSAQWHELLDK